MSTKSQIRIMFYEINAKNKKKINQGKYCKYDGTTSQIFEFSDIRFNFFSMQIILFLKRCVKMQHHFFSLLSGMNYA